MQADGDVLDRTQHLAAVAVAQPAEFRQEDAIIRLIELAALRIAEAVAFTLLLETGKRRPFGEEVAVGAFQVLERLLQGLRRRVCEPLRRRAIFHGARVFLTTGRLRCPRFISPPCKDGVLRRVG